MGTRGVALLLCLTLAGCERVVDSAQPVSEAAVAPITAGQAVDLLSPKVAGVDGNLFVTVEPDDCAGVAREADPPFISEFHPAATDGGHWTAEGAAHEVYVEEMVGVYRADYSARDALATVKRTLEHCRGTSFAVTSMQKREYHFQLLPAVESGSPDMVLWSFTSDGWSCDSAFVAAHNAAIEISTCGYTGGYDVKSLASNALKRIQALANATA